MSNLISKLGILPELQSFSLFEGFTDQQIELLCKDVTVKVTRHKESLFQFKEQAEHFYIILSGAYKLTRPTPNGEDSILHFAHTGDVIAAFIMAQPQPIYPITAISMGPSRALKIHRSNYIENWKNNGDLIFKIQNLLSTRMTSMQNQRALSKSPLQAKIASLLIDLIDKQPTTVDKITIPIPLTRKEIADSVGASVESIIRIMSEWSKKGLITTEDQNITIIKTDKIIELMNADY
ncbi:MAG: Crp/Fnr family transcriptional regulator [Bdellovibrionaceae bacterium]|nr:Crp/Fnr family transcriptional regulator [Pseudobdellovibrionaceae bacterium]